MYNPLTQLKEIVEETHTTFSRYVGNGDGLKDEILQSIDDNTLQIMVYGAYNAGKSTLINAMFGKEKARVNDIPTTDRVDQYTWKGFRLVDTPGVNAPIKHKQMTEEQVKRTGLFLFVIREGDQDSKDLYLRLFDMLKRRKKTFIILNYETPYLQNQAQAQHKINEILCAMAEQNNISDEEIGKIPVLPINAHAAFKGSCKNASKLLDHSGYTGFITEFTSWAARHDNKIRNLATLQQHINEVWFSPVINAIETQMGNGEDTEFFPLQRQRSILENQQRHLMHEANAQIVKEVNALKGDVANILETTKSEPECNAQLEQLFTPLLSRIENWLNSQIEGPQSSLLLLAETQAPSQEENSSENPLTELGPSALKMVDKDMIHEGLRIGRKLKIPGLKGRWDKTLGTWAGKAAIALQVAMSLWEMIDAHKKQNKLNEANKQRAVALWQATEKICSTVTGDLNNGVRDLLSPMFDEQISLIQNEIDKLKQNADTLALDLEKMQQDRDRANALHFG